MGLETVWQKFAYTCYQVWVWLRHEVTLHPFLFAGTVIVIVAAWILYKAEVKTK